MPRPLPQGDAIRRLLRLDATWPTAITMPRWRNRKLVSYNQARLASLLALSRSARGVDFTKDYNSIKRKLHPLGLRCGILMHHRKRINWIADDGPRRTRGPAAPFRMRELSYETILHEGAKLHSPA